MEHPLPPEPPKPLAGSVNIHRFQPHERHLQHGNTSQRELVAATPSERLTQPILRLPPNIRPADSSRPSPTLALTHINARSEERAALEDAADMHSSSRDRGPMRAPTWKPRPGANASIPQAESSRSHGDMGNHDNLDTRREISGPWSDSDMELDRLAQVWSDDDGDAPSSGSMTFAPRSMANSHSPRTAPIPEDDDVDGPDGVYEEEPTSLDIPIRYFYSRFSGRVERRNVDDSYSPSPSPGKNEMKRSREKLESPRCALAMLFEKGFLSLMLYHSNPWNPQWPDFRNVAKMPARYYPLRKDSREPLNGVLACRNLEYLQKLVLSAELPKDMDENKGGNLMPCSQGWPAGRVPTELYEEVAGYLGRDDIKSMRLTCREFNGQVAQLLFRTVVVPFNTDIYGVLAQEKQDLKGKKRVRMENRVFPWKNADSNDVYNGHGLDIFRAFGQHILRFGMSFEVNENLLANLPEKFLNENLNSFWGAYNWPFDEYPRFASVAGLEFAADQTRRMTVAFSELSKVRELALSVDSGLGWLNGPDRSIRARILQRPPAVFGPRKEIPDRRAQAQKELWDYIESCHRSAHTDVKLAALHKMEVSQELTELHGAPFLQKQPAMPFIDPHLIQQAVPHNAEDMNLSMSSDNPEVLDRYVLEPSATGTGILYTSTVPQPMHVQLLSAVIPANLTKAQEEWLLETEWAQRAFLSSYMLSIIDNPKVFGHVHTLNISRISDRYLYMLERQDFWDTLQSLKNVTLQVIPNYRTVRKDETGSVEAPKISPCTCIDFFYFLLRDVIGHRRNITHITFGWATGGEHAEGLHARNKLLMPAPLLPADSATEQDAKAMDDALLRLPHVESLRLKNSWMTPAVLEQFVKEHDRYKLRDLTLDSISLWSVLGIAGNGLPNNPPGPVLGHPGVNPVQQQQNHQPPAPASQPQATLRGQPRVGSWLSVLDVISPGLNLSGLGSEFSRADPERTTRLESVRFVSCGYAKLPYFRFEPGQPPMDGAIGPDRNPLLFRKFNALSLVMLSAKWPLVGEIVQDVDPAELAALHAGWDLETGWQDAEAAQGPEFDGLLPGGTGRFTGVVQKQEGLDGGKPEDDIRSTI